MRLTVRWELSVLLAGLSRNLFVLECLSLLGCIMYNTGSTFPRRSNRGRYFCCS